MNTFYGVNPPASSPNWVKNSRPLGIFTKSHVILTQQGLQRTHEFILQDQSAKLLPKERVCNCLKKRIDKTKDREVKYNETRKKAHWANVQRCGSVWTCPVCAKQITEKRRSELEKGLNQWKTAHNGSVLLLTLTFSHSVNESLSSLLAGQKRAYKRFCENTRVVNLMKSLSVRHKVKGFEVTYGKNGWHPHNHILLLTENSIEDFKQHQDELAQIWINCCTKSGLNAPSMEHGLDLRDGQCAEKYVSKWGLEHELTKGHVKQGRNGGLTPFDLLQYSMTDAEMNGRKLGTLFQEFAISTKGARQLVWSRGLKSLLGIEEKSDEELAEETEQEAISLRTVDDFAFSLLCTYQVRHEFLRCLERDWENGCFGNGEAERLLVALVEHEIERLNAET
ncbi:rolling circle replication protein, Rep63 protein (plasmid) [Acinetobacter tandoii]|nr:rolling circle replication protein, Rep63 protein [Acinetobacter tandoii]